jgi:hypothetical protein
MPSFSFPLRSCAIRFAGVVQLAIWAMGIWVAIVASMARAEQPLYFSQAGVAVNGFDVVSYFVNDAPVTGSRDQSVMWKGAVWQFSSARNREMFEADPRAFAPQFGGYCAYAMSKGRVASTDPMAFAIRDGKLYLIHNSEMRVLWMRDVADNIVLAKQNWPDAVLRN